MVVGIFGATASGKSALALALARRVPCEIVSVDAMQVYAGVETLTNQPTAAERAEVAHHLVGYLPLTAASSVGAHAPLAQDAIDAAARREALPLVVGGTGLYLRAALAELALPPSVPPVERERWERFYDERGASGALEELERLDARAAARLHPNDRRRVVRALELAGQGASLVPERDRLWGGGMRRPSVVAVLSWPRAELRARIAERTGLMLASGAVEEVRTLRAAGTEPSPTAARILGLAQLGGYLDGRRTLEDVAEEITLRTGQYARRQETWARRIPEVIELAGADGPERNADRLLELIR
ncbi:MAG TPA: tRNA (adenosine(37)-N6)-dimethylallyltransferase MiaA [Gaiellales bacterium]|jgi:tRNA dimethylallyltransferase|nr:tRNA (adenosine(37)-N6)-dimethylallyltransferase MiaA [Gaiellales bacterium]